MRLLLRAAACLILGGAFLPAADVPNPRVVMQTSLGPITLEIFAREAPVTAANFLRYVDEGRFAGSSFYRVVRMDNQPELDFGGRRNPDGQGFAAFGRVVEGMEVVRKIQRLPANGQLLAEPVRILSVARQPAGPRS